ncbi:MAG: ATP-binding protein [Phycisphaerales bacterium]|nr:ATP-binding protein [Phycisphaerales bacterium]
MTAPDRDALEVHRDDLRAAQDRVLEAADRHGYSEASQFAIRLALEEGIRNAFNHGHRDLDLGEPVRLEYVVTDAEVRLAIEDKGPGFDPGDVPDPTLDENLFKPTGRGLLLMRSYMAEVSHNDRGNRVEMVYRRP